MNIEHSNNRNADQQVYSPYYTEDEEKTQIMLHNFLVSYYEVISIIARASTSYVFVKNDEYGIFSYLGESDEKEIFNLSLIINVSYDISTLDTRLYRVDNEKDFNTISSTIINYNKIQKKLSFNSTFFVKDISNNIIAVILLEGIQINFNLSQENADVLRVVGENISLASGLMNRSSRIYEQAELLKLRLSKMNKIKDTIISSAFVETINGLAEEYIDVMSVIMNIDLGFIALYNEEDQMFQIKKGINLSNEGSIFKLKKVLSSLLSFESVNIIGTSMLSDIFEKEFIDEFLVESNGIYLKPLVDDRNNSKLIGVLAILSVSDEFLNSENNNAIYELLGDYLATGMVYIKKLRRLKEDIFDTFERGFLRRMAEADSFGLDLFVGWYHYDMCFLFKSDISEVFSLMGFKDYIKYDNQNYFVYGMQEEMLNKFSTTIFSGYKSKIYRYKKDFKDIDGFKAMIEK